MIPQQLWSSPSPLIRQFLLSCKVRPCKGHTHRCWSVTTTSPEPRWKWSAGIHLIVHVSWTSFLKLAHGRNAVQYHAVSTLGFNALMLALVDTAGYCFDNLNTGQWLNEVRWHDLHPVRAVNCMQYRWLINQYLFTRLRPLYEHKHVFVQRSFALSAVVNKVMKISQIPYASLPGSLLTVENDCNTEFCQLRGTVGQSDIIVSLALISYVQNCYYSR